MGDGPFIDRVGGSPFYPGQVPDPVSPPSPTVPPSAAEPSAANSWQQGSSAPGGSRPWLTGNVVQSPSLGRVVLILATVAALVLVPLLIWLSHRGDGTADLATESATTQQTFTAQGLPSLMPGLKTVSAPGVALKAIPNAPSSIRLQVQGPPGVKVDIRVQAGLSGSQNMVLYPKATLPFTLDLPVPFPQDGMVHVYTNSDDYQNPPILRCTLTIDGVVAQSDFGTGYLSCSADDYHLNPR